MGGGRLITNLTEWRVSILRHARESTCECSFVYIRVWQWDQVALSPETLLKSQMDNCNWIVYNFLFIISLSLLLSPSSTLLFILHTKTKRCCSVYILSCLLTLYYILEDVCCIQSQRSVIWKNCVSFAVC